MYVDKLIDCPSKLSSAMRFDYVRLNSVTYAVSMFFGIRLPKTSSLDVLLVNGVTHRAGIRVTRYDGTALQADANTRSRIIDESPEYKNLNWFDDAVYSCI